MNLAQYNQIPMNSPRMKSFRSKLKLKIDTKLTAFKASSSNQSSPTSTNKHPMLSTISESTSVKYNKKKKNNSNFSKTKPSGINIKRRRDSTEHKQNGASPFNYNHRNIDHPSTPTPYNSPYNPSTPRKSNDDQCVTMNTPCIGYDTPCNDRGDNIHYNYDINIENQESMECDDNIGSPITPVTPKTPITPHSYRDRQRRMKAVKHRINSLI